MSVTISDKGYTFLKTKTMEKKLIEGFIEEDAKTLQWVYQNYAPSIYGHVIKNGGAESDAADVMQMTMIIVHHNLKAGKYNHNGKFKHYFVKIGMNTWRNEKRKRQRYQGLDGQIYALEDDSEETLAAAIVKNDQVDILYRALKMLDSVCRDLIQLHYFDGQKLIDIAKDRDEKPSTIRVQLKRCRDKIKKVIERL